MSRLAALLHRAGIPGFRSDNRRNQVFAAIGYALIAIAFLGGYWYSAFLGLFALSVVFLATNAWGVRTRVPGFRSTRRLAAAGTWLGYAVAGLLVTGTFTVTVDANHLAANRAAQLERARNATASPAVLASARPSIAPSSPSPSATPSPSTSSASRPPTSSVPTFAIAAVSGAVCAGRDPRDHVYNPYRLVLQDPCKTATGTVMFTRREADGDWHIGLHLDDGQESLLNAKNLSDEQGDLVAEVICALPITQADAVSACSGYANTIPIPTVGSHISVTGPYVLDADHGWMEIHPVWSLNSANQSTPGPTASAIATVVPVTPAATVLVTTPTPAPQTVAPVAPLTSAPTTAANLCGAAANPWGYNFCSGSLISSPPSNFCSYFSCIASFSNGAGYVMQCSDLTFSLSGGRQGSCSRHGGNYRPLYAP
ncbi:MAG: hypothetical protein KGK34_02470 [Chloroflexota bacterium]|nr:hypothetical protein [Chloroflexota bacterium]